jgi:excisionase family DNA binding protein
MQTITEVAAVLGISRRHVYRLLKAGKLDLPHVMVGTRLHEVSGADADALNRSAQWSRQVAPPLGHLASVLVRDELTRCVFRSKK